MQKEIEFLSKLNALTPEQRENANALLAAFVDYVLRAALDKQSTE